MLYVKLICVGKMRERFYLDAFAEYRKRLQGYCRLELCEIGEQRLPDAPSEKEIAAALELCFIVGGSCGLAESVKRRCDRRLSMSEMTFPHHLARVMLIEQIYRGFKINEGARYHK